MRLYTAAASLALLERPASASETSAATATAAAVSVAVELVSDSKRKDGMVPAKPFVVLEKLMDGLSGSPPARTSTAAEGPTESASLPGAKT